MASLSKIPKLCSNFILPLRPLVGSTLLNVRHYTLPSGSRHQVVWYSDLKDKVALVTGIGQAQQTIDPSQWGNGAATAKLLANNGVKVFGCDLRLKDAERTKQRILEDNEDAIVEVGEADVTKSDEVSAVVQRVLDKFGRIDILVNNVGMSRPGGPADMSVDAFRSQLEVNLTSTFLCCHEVIPIMEKQQAGAITVTSSIAGLGYIGKMHIGYSTTKAALLNFAKCTAVQYAPKGIRINAVIPGLIRTPLVERLANEYQAGDYEKLVKRRDEGVPLGRQGTAMEVANATLFLVSDAASYITGTSLTVDGGVTAVVSNKG
ncbi:uncharacterized protein Z519_01817 [Cladophialophora bantiana CBS 173.52]|uniref:Uncharacterized protein n=1 Tax=Cladophialophora bantiana (strain ATCC 10958 / CBS 173.52 / CDC B-1940 / NIH 8579) TaxID=1442370 RepID=A0A0D2HXU0_CLAB1|nr:uncharacterized protein Z519_01817 [Cladophialophora bantiana CBS 173.52]KIW98233.1 hypothetical protein Z519_01817 [Cladophialophora bantiana CBS 173.52]